MKRGLRIFGIAIFILIIVCALAVWNAAFNVPRSEQLPIPASLIAIDSDPGRELLASKEFVADYDRLSSVFEPQSRRAFCGVASAVVAVNALRNLQPRLTQSTFFTDAASKVRGSLQVTFGGMSLHELAALLRAHGLEATVFYASETGIDTFRSVAKQNLQTETDMLLVNYQRAALGQEEMGHISPIAAYNVTADRLLVLDVASYKYPSVWVHTEAMWKAMNTTDPASGRSRGFVVVREGQQQLSLASAFSRHDVIEQGLDPRLERTR